MTHRPEMLAARFGDLALPDVLIVLTACCVVPAMWNRRARWTDESQC